MKRALFLVLLLSLQTAFADQGLRYQMLELSNGQLVLLDSLTGQSWRSLACDLILGPNKDPLLATVQQMAMGKEYTALHLCWGKMQGGPTQNSPKTKEPITKGIKK